MTEYSTKLKEVMTKSAHYIDPSTNLVEAAEKMRDLDVGFLPVGDGQKLTGTLTDRDIVIRAVANKADPEHTKVGDILTEEVLYAYADQDIEFAIKTMQAKKVRRLLIINRDKDLVGVVSLGDLATRLNESQPKAKAVEAVSHG